MMGLDEAALAAMEARLPPLRPCPDCGAIDKHHCADGDLRTPFPQADSIAHALLAEVRRLRAVVKGRTVPPTDAQIREHLRDKPDGSTGWHRGSWLITGEYGEVPMVRRTAAACIVIAEEQRARQPSWCWIALDRDGRPTDWPVTP